MDPVSRRGVLRRTSGAMVGAALLSGAHQTVRADEHDGGETEVPDKYVVYAPLSWAGANSRIMGPYIRNAVDLLNEELAYEGEITFIDAQIQNGPNGEIEAEWWNPTLDQAEVFDHLLEAFVEMPEEGIKQRILSQMDEDDPTLSNAHFVFTHDVGSVNEASVVFENSEGDPNGVLGIGISIGGWGGKTPVRHGPVADQEMHGTLLGPAALFDPRGLYGDACFLLGDINRPTWKARRLAWQSVGHALGASHTDGGYRLDERGETIRSVSVMAAGHLFDRFGYQDMKTKDGDPYFDISTAVRNDDNTARTEGGEFLEDRWGYPEPRRHGLADFQGWGGGSNPVLSAELPLDTDAYPEVLDIEDPEEIEDFDVYSGCVELARGKQMKPIHPRTFTDRSLSRMEETIAFDPPGVSLNVFESSGRESAGGWIRTDDEFILEAVARNIDADRIEDWEATLPSAPSIEGEDDPQMSDLIVEEEDLDGLYVYTLTAGNPGEHEIEVAALPPEGETFRQSGVEYDSVSATTTVTIATPLAPVIDVGDARFGVGETIVIDGSDSEGEISSFTWSIEGPSGGSDAEQLLGTLGGGEVIERSFYVVGEYEVELTIEETDTGVTRSTTTTFELLEGEEGSEEDDPDGFTIAIEGPDTASQHTPVTFAPDVEFTTTTVTSYEWGGAVSATTEEVVARFDERGNYEVTLTAENRNGNVDTATTGVAVTDTSRPEVAIEGPAETAVDTIVEFAADAGVEGGEITSYEWNGGVDNASGDTAVVEADAPGAVDVEVTVTADSGATNTARKSLDVRSEASDGRPPTVSIAGPQTVEQGSTATYEAVADDDGEVTGYEWNGAATGTGPSVETTFEDLAIQVLKVRVTDDDSRTSTASTAVSVTATPPADNEPPGVTVLGPDEVLVGDAAEYTAVADDPDGSVATYDWNVGGVGETAMATFDSPGLQTIQVTVTDTQGATTTTGMDVRVRPRQAGDLETSAIITVPDRVPVDEPVTFEANESTGADSYAWSLEEVLPFGTNADVPLSNSSGETVTVTFEKTATYALTLTVENGDGETDSTTEVFDAEASTYLDTFSDGDLTEYVAPQGSTDNWNVEPKIQGNSAHVDASGVGNQAIVAEGFEWTGTGTVEFDFQLAGGFNQNARVTMGSARIPESIRVRIALGGGSQVVRANVGSNFSSSSGVNLGSTAQHHATVTVTEDRITVRVDGSVRHTADVSGVSLPSGPVGIGMTSNSGRGGETWFDNLYVESG